MGYRIFANLLIVLFLLITSVLSTFAEDETPALCIAEKLRGAAFLHKRNPNLYSSDPVRLLANTIEQRTGQSLTQPAQRIAAWLDYLNDYRRSKEDPEVSERIRNAYYKQLVTPENEIPESFYDLQRRIAREQGHGNIQLGPNEKSELAKIELADQKKSLDEWLDYFSSPYSESFPMWAKYWAFDGMTKLGKYDPEKGSFSTRSKGLVAPFPDLNREALALVIDAVEKKVKGVEPSGITDPDFLRYLESANFGKLYGRALQLATEQKINISSVDGKWVTFKQGSEPGPLVESLRGMNTGWCTAGANTARSQLKGGDFHVFYSNDDKGDPVNPRIAIRMQGDKIGEIRGIAERQNLDKNIAGTEVLQKKLKEFGKEGEAYQKKSSDMKLLSLIELKSNKGTPLTSMELRFLYEIDGTIEGFGFHKDPRVAEIIAKRNPKKDLAQALHISEDEVSTTTEEALSGKSKYHYGNLVLSQNDVGPHTKLPELVTGRLTVDLSRLSSTKDFIFPKSVKGKMSVILQSGSEVTFPKIVEGDFEILKGETLSKESIFPESVGEQLKMDSLKSLDGLTLPHKVGKSLSARSAETAKNTKFPDWVEISFGLPKLQSAEKVVLPLHIGWHVTLSSLRNADGLKFPPFLKGLDLSSLESGNNLVLPKTIEHDLDLKALRSGQGITFPDSVNTLKLESLETTEGLHLPAHMASLEMNLTKMKSTKDLTFPQSFGAGNLVLVCPQKLDKLVLPRSVLGRLYMNGLQNAEGVEFPEFVGELYLNQLKSKEGIVLPVVKGMPK